MTNHNAQQHIIENLKKHLADHHSLADFLMLHLNISSDSAYRRIRGETSFTVQELSVLSEKTGASPNELMGTGSNGIVPFVPTLANELPYSYTGYLQQIAKQVNDVMALQDPQIIYASKDIPFFHCLLYPELAYFKHHFWTNIVMESDGIRVKPYLPDQDDDTIRHLQKDILKRYCSIQSSEIWNTESINGTLFQIDFYRNAGYFDNAAQIRTLYDKLAETLGHIEKEAALGKKYLPGTNYDIVADNFHMYYNQVTLSDNTILVSSSDIKIAVLNFGILSYLTCFDRGFCHSISRELDNLIRRSTKLSSGNMRHRSMFFNTIYEKINRYKKLA